MNKKYTKDQLVKELIDAHGRVCALTEGVQGALNQINHNNVLHRQELRNNTEAIKSAVKAARVVMFAFGGLFALMIVALIVLSGAEKALNYWPQIISIFNPLK